jgi:putative thioredoxin
LLERLAEEASGTFRLAKVDVDNNPNLTIRFAIKTVPTVKAFRDGQVVGEFVGILPEGKVREFIRSLAPGEHDLILEKANSLLTMSNWPAAEKLFRQFLRRAPENPAGLLGLARSLLAQNTLPEAEQLLRRFPASKEYAAADALAPVLRAYQWSATYPGYSDDPLEAAFANALRLGARGNFAACLDGLLDVLRENKRYRSGEVHRVVLGLLTVLGDDHALTPEYRAELAKTLF